ncbi:MAG: aldehyde dehydrogenase [Haloglomus sp.]
MSIDIPRKDEELHSIRRRHTKAAAEYISRQKQRLYIGGEWVESRSGQTFQTHDPMTGDVLANVPAGTSADVDRAVAAAWEAYRKHWCDATVTERQQLLHRIADRVEEQKEKFAVLDSLDNGKPITEARTDIDLFVDQFRYFGGVIRGNEGSIVPNAEGQHIQTVTEPYGVVGQIVPWNFPMLMTAWKLAPALATGNSVVIKPAEQTPLSILELIREIEDLLPPGVVNVITGYGPEAGEPIVSHDDVPKVAFTGSTEVGQGVVKSAALGVTDVTLELGGKSPVIIYPDVSIEKAVETSVRAMFFNNGECCSAGSRLFVHSDIEASFVDAFVEAVEDLRLGDPLNEETDLGPQVNPSQANKTMQYLTSLREDGARILTGGYEPSEEPFDDGCFVAPTVVTDVSHDARGVQEEIFGPVEVLFSWDDYDEMIRQANDVDYGLAGGVITNDITDAYRTAADLDAGNIWINTYNQFPAGQPFGGVKQSGTGREVGEETLDEYTQTKTISIEFE